MPESPFDDPFADLFGKLPDPRSRDLGRSASEGDGGAATVGSAAGAPPSRRAAREAAARHGSTGAHDVPVNENTGPRPVTASDASAARPAAAARESATSAPASSTPAPSTPASEPAAPASQPPLPAGQAPERAAPSTPTPDVTAPAPDATAPAPEAAARQSSEQASVQVGTPSPAARRDETLVRTRDDAAAGAAAGAERRPARTSSPALEDLFAGASTTDELGTAPPPPNKRKRRIGGWIALGVVLVILGGITAGGLWVWNTYEAQIREVMGWEEPKDYDAGLANGEAFLTIVSGDTGASISPKLFEAGVTKTSDAFYDYLVDAGENPPFVPGVFALQKQMTSEAALAAIMDPANKRENTAQLREGLTVEQSLPLLAEGMGLPIEDFQAAVADPTVYGVPLDAAVAAAGGQPLEGWLFPATYTFDPGATAQDVIQRLVNETISRLDAAGVPAEDRQRILTVASIIQREARFEADMQKVSTVIVNRMKPDNQETFGLLQMDSTAQYGYGEMHDGSVSSSGEALTDDNPWNTYVKTGLPVGPIANPGDVAIEAAVNPAQGDWLYFVTVNLNTGETVFTTNNADHQRAVDQWINWCRDNPDAGC